MHNKKILALVLVVVFSVLFISCPNNPTDLSGCKNIKEVREAIIKELIKTGQLNADGSIPTGTVELTGDFNFIKLSPLLTDLSGLFYGGNDHNIEGFDFKFKDIAAIFNGDVSNWNVIYVKKMDGMFFKAEKFNQSLKNWNVSNVTDMNLLFADAKVFNQPLNNWNVSNVTGMVGMFSGTNAFNQPLNSWNVSNVTNMNGAFAESKVFNQPLNNWNVSNVTNMDYMFYNATKFNQDLSYWDVNNVNTHDYIFMGSPMQGNKAQYPNDTWY